MNAALNTLKEERRRVSEARSAVLGDDALMAADPAHRRRLLDQMLIELCELDQAVALIEAARVEAREARVRELSTPPVRPREAAPASWGALRPGPGVVRRGSVSA